MKLENNFQQFNKSKSVGNPYDRIEEIFPILKNSHMDSQLPSLHLHFALSQYLFRKQNYCCTSMIASTLCLKPIYI